MLKRAAYERLVSWKKDPHHRALLVDGARQVGKTYLCLLYTSFLQDQLIWGIAYCGLAALSFTVIAIARREHPTMVTLTLLTIACVIPFLVLFAGTIGIFIIVLYFIFSLFRR